MEQHFYIQAQKKKIFYKPLGVADDTIDDGKGGIRMKKEAKTVVYDDELRIEAYRFEGIMQPFPNHFHEYYVIGFVEKGERRLSCKNQEYVIRKGNIAVRLCCVYIIVKARLRRSLAFVVG